MFSHLQTVSVEAFPLGFIVQVLHILAPPVLPSTFTCTTTPLHHNYNYNYNYNCATPHNIKQLWWGDRCNYCNHSKSRNSNHLSVHQWIRSAFRDSQQPISPIGFLFLKLPPPPSAVLLVFIYTHNYTYRIVPFWAYKLHMPCALNSWRSPRLAFCTCFVILAIFSMPCTFGMQMVEDDASGGEPNVYNDLIFLTQRAHCLSSSPAAMERLSKKIEPECTCCSLAHWASHFL